MINTYRRWRLRLLERFRLVPDDMPGCYYESTREAWNSGYLAAIYDTRDQMDRLVRVEVEQRAEVKS